MTTLDEIKENIKEYIEDADMLFERGRYNSALNLYFKALVGICDYIIFRDTRRLPRNHSERFRILENRYPDIYDIVDYHFTHYRRAYMKRAEKEWVEVLKDDVHNLYSHL